MFSNTVKKKTILVVDDVAVNIAVIKAILVPEFSVKGATNGERAIVIAESDPPDLILLDIIMPDMNGYEVLQQLKKNEATREIPVLFVTSKDDTDDETFGMELGAVDYIVKPITPSILLARVRTQIILADSIRRLTIQNKALISAARLRDDVDHILQHDLKSPLNVIIGVPQLLMLKCNFSNEDKEFVNLIKDSGYRMLDMINRSLDLFKMEYGSYKLELCTVDVIGVIKGVLAELQSAILEKQLLIIILVNERDPIDNEPVEVQAENLLCHSLFSNLIKNAIEASPHLSTLCIKFFKGLSVTIFIENEGEVPESIRSNFFEKFVTAGKTGGTGIGTYSAKLIASTMRGSIALDTSVAGRTCVQVTLLS